MKLPIYIDIMKEINRSSLEGDCLHFVVLSLVSQYHVLAN